MPENNLVSTPTQEGVLTEDRKLQIDRDLGLIDEPSQEELAASDPQGFYTEFDPVGDFYEGYDPYAVSTEHYTPEITYDDASYISKRPEKTEDEEPDYLTGTAGEIINAIPFGIGDFIDDTARAIGAGITQGGAVADAFKLLTAGGDYVPSDEELDNLVSSYEATKNNPVSQEYKDFMRIYEEEGKSIFGFLKGLAQNPSVVSEIAITSLVSMFNSTSLQNALIVGGGVGAATGGIGAIPAAMGAASATLDSALSFNEFLQEELDARGLEFDKEGIRTLMENHPDAMSRIRTRAAARGTVIGVIDGLTGRLAGQVGARVLGKTKSAALQAGRGRRLASKATTIGLEGAGGGVGETAARLVAGQELDVAEIGLEIVGEFGPGAVSVAQTAIAANKLPDYTIGDEISSKEDVELFIKDTPIADLTSAIEEGRIKIENDPTFVEEIEDIVETRIVNAQTNENIKGDARVEYVSLEKDRRALEGNSSPDAKVERSAIEARQKEIAEEQLFGIKPKPAEEGAPKKPTIKPKSKINPEYFKDGLERAREEEIAKHEKAVESRTKAEDTAKRERLQRTDVRKISTKNLTPKQKEKVAAQKKEYARLKQAAANIDRGKETRTTKQLIKEHGSPEAVIKRRDELQNQIVDTVAKADSKKASKRPLFKLRDFPQFFAETNAGVATSPTTFQGFKVDKPKEQLRSVYKKATNEGFEIGYRFDEETGTYTYEITEPGQTNTLAEEYKKEKAKKFKSVTGRKVNLVPLESAYVQTVLDTLRKFFGDEVPINTWTMRNDVFGLVSNEWGHPAIDFNFGFKDAYGRNSIAADVLWHEPMHVVLFMLKASKDPKANRLYNKLHDLIVDTDEYNYIKSQTAPGKQYAGLSEEGVRNEAVAYYFGLYAEKKTADVETPSQLRQLFDDIIKYFKDFYDKVLGKDVTLEDISDLILADLVSGNPKLFEVESQAVYEAIEAAAETDFKTDGGLFQAPSAAITQDRHAETTVDIDDEYGRAEAELNTAVDENIRNVNTGKDLSLPTPEKVPPVPQKTEEEQNAFDLYTLKDATDKIDVLKKSSAVRSGYGNSIQYLDSGEAAIGIAAGVSTIDFKIQQEKEVDLHPGQTILQKLNNRVGRAALNHLQDKTVTLTEEGQVIKPGEIVVVSPTEQYINRAKKPQVGVTINSDFGKSKRRTWGPINIPTPEPQRTESDIQKINLELEQVYEDTFNNEIGENETPTKEQKKAARVKANEAVEKRANEIFEIEGRNNKIYNKTGYDLLSSYTNEGIDAGITRGRKEEDPYVFEIFNSDYFTSLIRAINREPGAKKAWYTPNTNIKSVQINEDNVTANGRHIVADRGLYISKEKYEKAREQAQKANNVAYTVDTGLLNILEHPEIKKLPFMNFTGSKASVTSKERVRDNVLATAKDLAGKPFYHTHYFDFRGRMYASASYFNYQGSKLALALHRFDNPTALGKDGWKWLMINAADAGAKYDTTEVISDNDRFKYATDKLNDWIKWADNPITYAKEWSAAKEPERFLAAIREIAAAVRSGDVTTFESGFPITFDATNSGGQIFSLLLRDEASGKLVNLVDSIVKQDLYTKVSVPVWETMHNRLGKKETTNKEKFIEVTRALNDIEQRRKKITNSDLSREEKHKQHKELDKVEKKARKKGGALSRYNMKIAAAYFWTQPKLQGSIRDISKLPVMIKFYSAKPRIMAKQLVQKFKDKPLFEGLNEDLAFELTKVFYKQADAVFPAGKLGREIIQKLSKEMSNQGKGLKSTGVVNGFPFIENYRDIITEKFQFSYAGPNPNIGETLGGNIISGYGRIDAKRMQRSGAPNYVHHLDSQIVAYVINKMTESMTIHDNFLVSPGDAQALYDTVREGTVEIFSNEVLFDTIKENLGEKAGNQFIEDNDITMGDMNVGGVAKTMHSYTSGAGVSLDANASLREVLESKTKAIADIDPEVLDRRSKIYIENTPNGDVFIKPNCKI